MKIVTISDTHGQHERLTLPGGDVLIHAGDVSNIGRKAEVLSFLDWFVSQPFQHKIFIAGNHDFFFEREQPYKIKEIIPPGITYLNDSAAVINGFKIWGSPVTPWFLDWAFNRQRGGQIDQHWQLVPADTDILITHGPPNGLLDVNSEGEHTGCKDLLRKVKEVKPVLHLFGHIHEGYGRLEDKDTTFINASVLNEKYQLVNPPGITELKDLS